MGPNNDGMFERMSDLSTISKTDKRFANLVVGRILFLHGSLAAEFWHTLVSLNLSFVKLNVVASPSVCSLLKDEIGGNGRFDFGKKNILSIKLKRIFGNLNERGIQAHGSLFLVEENDFMKLYEDPNLVGDQLHVTLDNIPASRFNFKF